MTTQDPLVSKTAVLAVIENEHIFITSRSRHELVAAINALPHATAQGEVERLREALTFYAAAGTYMDDISPAPTGDAVPYSAPIWGDEGATARAAIHQEPKDTDHV